MNEQTPQAEETPKKYHWGRFWIGILVVIGFLIVRGLFSSSTNFEYKILDYSAVLANPDLYSGQLARLEAVTISTVKSDDSDNTYIVVSEPDYDDHVWLVYGELPSSDLSRLEPGVSLILYGICEGTHGVSMSYGSDSLPAIRFSECVVGVQTGRHSDFLYERNLSRLEDEVWSRDFPDEPHQYTLSAGNYDLRQDIPGGNCAIRWVSGYGNVSGDTYKDTVFALMGDPAEHPGAETELDDVRLSFGILSVCGDLVVSVEYRNVNFEAEPNYQRTGEYMEFTAGTYTVGDIPGFTKYDLEAVAGSGTVMGGSSDWYGVRENMSATPGPGEISKFSGFVLMNDAEQLTIIGDLVLRLYPYAQIDRDSLSAAPETTVTLSAPEADKIPEDPAPETEAPAEVIPLEPESPAETMLDEWFALVDARTHRSTYGDEEEETTLEEWFAKTEAEAGDRVQWYTVNTSTHVIHDSDNCYNAKQIKPENRSYTDDPYSLIAEGYTWCGTCHKVP